MCGCVWGARGTREASGVCNRLDSVWRCSAFSFLGVSMGIRKGTAFVLSPLLVLYIYACRFASMLAYGGFKPDTPYLTIVKGARIVKTVNTKSESSKQGVKNGTYDSGARFLRNSFRNEYRVFRS